MIAILDQFDAPALFKDLSEAIPNLMVAPNNSAGLPDFWFTDYLGKGIGVSLKQVGELLSGLDRVTEQLQRDSRSVDRLYLVVTGVMVPAQDGTVVVIESPSGWKEKGKPGRAWYLHEPYRFSYFGYRKWIETLSLYGIEVREPGNKAAQVATLQSLYEHYQVPPEEHKSFEKVIRTKMSLPPDASPFVKSLMGLCDAKTGRTFVGEETAKAIAGEYDNLFSLMRELEEEEAYPRLYEGKHVKDICLASGRRIGETMAARIKGALG